jgi:mannose-6-phosphate isomerase-like protein (cupin superfamily)
MRTLNNFINIRYLLFSNLILALFLVSCNESQGQKYHSTTVQTEEQVAVPQEVKPKAKPFALDIEKGTMENENYREVSWTGEYMQLVFMSIAPGGKIDLEVHNELDQFIRVEQGKAQILLGENRDELNIEKNAEEDWAVLIPAGYWHIVENTGKTPLKIYVLYSPASHPEGIVHEDYEEAREYAEEHGH